MGVRDSRPAAWHDSFIRGEEGGVAVVGARSELLMVELRSSEAGSAVCGRRPPPPRPFLVLPASLETDGEEEDLHISTTSSRVVSFLSTPQPACLSQTTTCEAKTLI